MLASASHCVSAVVIRACSALPIRYTMRLGAWPRRSRTSFPEPTNEALGHMRPTQDREVALEY